MTGTGEYEMLARAIPLLIRLGDFIGNGELSQRPNSLGERCDLIGDIRRALAAQTRVFRAKDHPEASGRIAGFIRPVSRCSRRGRTGSARTRTGAAA